MLELDEFKLAILRYSREPSNSKGTDLCLACLKLESVSDPKKNPLETLVNKLLKGITFTQKELESLDSFINQVLKKPDWDSGSVLLVLRLAYKVLESKMRDEETKNQRLNAFREALLRYLHTPLPSNKEAIHDAILQLAEFAKYIKEETGKTPSIHQLITPVLKDIDLSDHALTILAEINDSEPENSNFKKTLSVAYRFLKEKQVVHDFRLAVQEHSDRPSDQTNEKLRQASLELAEFARKIHPQSKNKPPRLLGLIANALENIDFSEEKCKKLAEVIASQETNQDTKTVLNAAIDLLNIKIDFRNAFLSYLENPSSRSEGIFYKMGFQLGKFAEKIARENYKAPGADEVIKELELIAPVLKDIILSSGQVEKLHQFLDKVQQKDKKKKDTGAGAALMGTYMSQVKIAVEKLLQDKDLGEYITPELIENDLLCRTLLLIDSNKSIEINEALLKNEKNLIRVTTFVERINLLINDYKDNKPAKKQLEQFRFESIGVLLTEDKPLNQKQRDLNVLAETHFKRKNLPLRLLADALQIITLTFIIIAPTRHFLFHKHPLFTSAETYRVSRLKNEAPELNIDEENEENGPALPNQ